MCVCVCVSFNRRSYVGVELVQWLCEQCVYVRCRTTAVRVWQVLLELGVLLSGKNTIAHTHTHAHTNMPGGRRRFEFIVTFQQHQQQSTHL